MVSLGLESDHELLTQLTRKQQASYHALNTLEQYHKAGSTLRSINVCAARIADMVKSLKGYARSDDETLHYADIHEGIEDTLVIFENKLKNAPSFNRLCKLAFHPLSTDRTPTGVDELGL